VRQPRLLEPGLAPVVQSSGASDVVAVDQAGRDRLQLVCPRRCEQFTERYLATQQQIDVLPLQRERSFDPGSIRPVPPCRVGARWRSDLVEVVAVHSLDERHDVVNGRRLAGRARPEQQEHHLPGGV
jgi:hypothetical protein